MCNLRFSCNTTMPHVSSRWVYEHVKRNQIDFLNKTTTSGEFYEQILMF